ncbi:MAG: PIN domain-containing protein [Micropruina sp.]|uniref:PIN domain-containing protein n=1 Tax=Micropruina sp. TaxID=2737536 RepID=UPI0039E44FD9
MTALFLVDNSVIQRLAQPAVRTAWDRLVALGDIATCLPTALEAGYSARNRADHARIMEFETVAKVFLAPVPAVAEIAFRLQIALFAAGQGRAVGVSDLQIAATAIHYATALDRPVAVLHYDADFEQLARVASELDARWIVPRGTLP